MVNNMSRDKNYQRLLNSPRWREVKTLVWRRANGLCERCIREGKAAGVPDGYITPGVDCHHIRPVESGRTVMEMEQLCYDLSNIELLCIPCHIKTHAEQRSHCREKVKENKQRARQRFMEANDPNFVSEREQGDACISHAEHEQSQPKVNWKPDEPQSANKS